jgi:hypothetical protein
VVGRLARPLFPVATDENSAAAGAILFFFMPSAAITIYLMAKSSPAKKVLALLKK